MRSDKERVAAAARTTATELGTSRAMAGNYMRFYHTAAALWRVRCDLRSSRPTDETSALRSDAIERNGRADSGPLHRTRLEIARQPEEGYFGSGTAVRIEVHAGGLPATGYQECDVYGVSRVRCLRRIIRRPTGKRSELTKSSNNTCEPS